MSIPHVIVIRSLALLRELSTEYGPTRAMEIWEQLADIIGDEDLKMEVFKLMLLGGKAGTHIEVRKWDTLSKVSAVQALRVWTSSPIKKAKSAVEAAEFGIRSSFVIAPMSKMINIEDGFPYDRITEELEEVGLSIDFV